MGLQNGITLTERSKPEDAPTRKEGTAQDKEDMWRVGRDQELNVRKASLDPYGLTLSSHAINHNNTSAEKFPVPVRSWLHSSAYVHLGSCSLVRQSYSLGRSRQLSLAVLTRHIISGASYGLINGGKGGMIYTYLGALAAFSFVILSMSEMASMYVCNLVVGALLRSDLEKLTLSPVNL
jgi:choline transport protein